MSGPIATSPLYVFAPVISAMLDAFSEIGGDVNGALRRAGLGRVAGALIEGRPTLVTRSAFARLAAECVLALHAEGCRRNGMQPVPVANHRLLLRAMLGCSTLGEAVQVLVEFHAAIYRGYPQWLISVDGGIIGLRLQRPHAEINTSEFLISAFGIACYHRLLGWLIGVELPLTEVTLAYPRRMQDLGLQALFNVPATFEQPQDGFAFPERFLDWPITAKPSEVDALFSLFPFDLLPPAYGHETLEAQIAGSIRTALARGEAPPDLKTLSRMFGLTPATFRRRLASDGLSLAKLRADCRRQMAIGLLRDTRLTVCEIAARLAYADTATFRRAFALWTGLTPALWRHHQATAPETLG